MTKSHLTGATKVISNNSERMLEASDFGVSQLNANEIAGGGSIESSAIIFTNILKGKGTEAQNNVVCANAGMAIATSKDLSPKEGFELAKESLLTGKGLEALKKLQALSEHSKF